MKTYKIFSATGRFTAPGGSGHFNNKNGQIMKKLISFLAILALPITTQAENLSIGVGGGYTPMETENAKTVSPAIGGFVKYELSDDFRIGVRGTATRVKEKTLERIPAEYETVTVLLEPASCSLVKTRCGGPQCVLTPEVTEEQTVMVSPEREKTHDRLFEVVDVAIIPEYFLYRDDCTDVYVGAGPTVRFADGDSGTGFTGILGVSKDIGNGFAISLEPGWTSSIKVGEHDFADHFSAFAFLSYEL